MATDLSLLLPEYFIKSPLLMDYVNAISQLLTSDELTSAISLINGLPDLVNPNTVPEAYIQRLADLINYKILISTTDDISTLRRQLLNVVSLYKIKGSYQALEYVAYLSNINVSIKDFYTNSEANYNAGTFTPEDWFVGDISSLPSDLSAGYFKTPHIGIYILLNKVLGTAPNDYLWNSTLATNFLDLVDLIRPVITVPHYYLQLSPVTNESRTVVTSAGNIKAAVNSNWTYNNVYFDNGNLFDSGKIFDTSDTSFFDSITKYKLGTGDKNTSPATSGFTLSTPVYTGTVTGYTVTSTSVSFNITVPTATTITGITEIGLFKANATTMVAAATFPNIDITNNNMPLNITFTVNRGH